MKKLMVLLLIFGLVFSTQFPETIENSDLVLWTANGGLENGSAVYVIPLTGRPDLTSEEAMEKASMATGVGAVPQSHEEFYKPQYEAGTWKKSEETNAECYYLTGVDAGSAVCNMNCHDGADTSYFLSTYIQNIDDKTLAIEMAYDQTVLVANAIIPAVVIHDENLGGAVQEETGTQEEEEESETCSPLFLLLIVTFGALIKK